VGFSEFIFGLKGLITAKIIVLGVLKCSDWARWDRTKLASAFAKASAGQEFIRKCVRISIKSADFRIKRASSCLKTVENG
jgi:hypothetical protein